LPTEAHEVAKAGARITIRRSHEAVAAGPARRLLYFQAQ